MGQRFNKEKETICWNCRNYSFCSWSRGKPVKGWTATATVIRETKQTPIMSYLVEACPHFKPDKKRRVSMAEISDIIGISERAIYGNISKKGYNYLRALLQEKGYILHTYWGTTQFTYYLEEL